MSVFQLLGEISANVLLTIMTNEPFVVSDDYTRFSSGPPALLEPSTNSVLLSLC